MSNSFADVGDPTEQLGKKQKCDCGHIFEGDSNFCDSCGAKKPEERIASGVFGPDVQKLMDRVQELEHQNRDLEQQLSEAASALEQGWDITQHPVAQADTGSAAAVSSADEEIASLRWQLAEAQKVEKELRKAATTSLWDQFTGSFCVNSREVTCRQCSKSLSGIPFSFYEEAPYCKDCYDENFGDRCVACAKPISGALVKCSRGVFHLGCVVCASCGKNVGKSSVGGQINCGACSSQNLLTSGGTGGSRKRSVSSERPRPQKLQLAGGGDSAPPEEPLALAPSSFVNSLRSPRPVDRHAATPSFSAFAPRSRAAGTAASPKASPRAAPAAGASPRAAPAAGASPRPGSPRAAHAEEDGMQVIQTLGQEEDEEAADASLLDLGKFAGPSKANSPFGAAAVSAAADKPKAKESAPAHAKIQGRDLTFRPPPSPRGHVE